MGRLGVPTLVWELFSGSGTFTSVVHRRRLGYMPPVDYRYGHNLDGRFGQGRTLWALLLYGVYSVVAAPTCTPWSANSRAWEPAVRSARRNSEKSCLDFLAVVILVQSLLGRYFV